MKRFTERDEFGNADIIGVDSMNLQGNLDFEELGISTRALNRLAELEDKLESGQLVELPCKVGDIILVPYVYNGVSAIMRLLVDEIQIAKYSITFCTDFETDDETFAIKFSHGLFLLGTFGDIWFTDKAQAEARLKELQERK